MSGEAHSRAQLGLTGQQQALLEVVQAARVRLVVLMSGRPLVIPQMAALVAAIVQAWYGGIRSGRAVMV